MRRTLYLIPAAMLLIAPQMQARSPKPVADSSTILARQADHTLSNIEAISRDAQKTAETLTMEARETRMGWEVHAGYLQQMRADLNRIGQYVAKLEAEQDSLPPIEREALAIAAPLFKDAASNLEQAIHVFNADPNRDTMFGGDLAFARKVLDDTSKANHALHDFAMLNKERRQEKRTVDRIGSVDNH